jgi:hypothetical protein
VSEVVHRASKWLLAACVFFSAFLLFLLEPLVGKSILPWFGGGASVWTTCMLFFQIVLLGGYAYAHLSTTRLGHKGQLWVHLALIGLAVAALPVIPPLQFRPSADADPIARALLVLSVTAGLPFLLLSTTGTLAQVWWARLHPDSPPYRLYALSNAGSMIGLLAYPAVLEPLVGLRMQAWVWSAGLVAFGLLCAVCAVIANAAAVPNQSTPAPQQPSAPVSPWRVVAWIVLPMIPSVMLLATTAALTQNVAPIPFLWIVPLAIYLVSFILCFEYPRAYRRALCIPVYAAVLIVLCALNVTQGTKWSLWLQLAVYCTLLFSGCMICHGELYRIRPGARHLSGFYLSLALGGAMGGVFAAVVAPLVFHGMWELHLSVAACALVCVVIMWGSRTSAMRGGRPAWAWFAVGMASAMISTVLWMDAAGAFLGGRLLARYRSFYAAMTVQRVVQQIPGDEARVLLHGGIIHGLQLEDPKRRLEPVSYYWPGTAISQLMRSTADKPRHIGITGLGAGALAAYGQQGDVVTIYEINPQVVDVARKWFTFLQDTPAEVRIILGDARISMERQEDQKFDILVLDAFSGDSVPVHLLTSEAVQLYLRHLKPDGVLVFHITNAYLDLEPVVARMAQRHGLALVISDTSPQSIDEGLRFGTCWALLSRNPANLDTEALRSISRPARPNPRVRLWTDDYSNLLRILY